MRTLTLLPRGLKHLRAGTLPAALSWQVETRIHRFRMSRWRRLGAGGHLVARLAGGARIALWGDSELGRLIYVYDFERHERAFLRALLRPGDIFVDVGANIGLFTVTAARIVGQRGHVHAFEPSGGAFQRLRANVRLNGSTNVSCHQLALSDRPGELPMQTAGAGFDAWNSLGRPTLGEQLAVEQIRATTWDVFAREAQITGPIAMMKVDVEGWERYALLGAGTLLGRPDAPVLQIELNAQAARAAGSSCEELIQQLTELGYRLWALAGRRLVPCGTDGEPPGDGNVIAIKDPGRVWARLRRWI